VAKGGGGFAGKPAVPIGKGCNHGNGGERLDEVVECGHGTGM
jgi:hypothetical protein